MEWSLASPTIPLQFPRFQQTSNWATGLPMCPTSFQSKVRSDGCLAWFVPLARALNRPTPLLCFCVLHALGHRLLVLLSLSRQNKKDSLPCSRSKSPLLQHTLATPHGFWPARATPGRRETALAVAWPAHGMLWLAWPGYG
jgi:hypothetical protein